MNVPCPARADGVHDLTASTVCACGYKLDIPRFMFSVEVYDNEEKKEIASKGFNCSHIESVIDELENVIRKLRSTR